mgnify:FL=1|jgi:hypothetical protein
MAPIQPSALREAQNPAVAFTRACSLCASHRLTGSLLTFGPGIGEEMVWVCEDCQHKLARRLDDEGALGG